MQATFRRCEFSECCIFLPRVQQNASGKTGSLIVRQEAAKKHEDSGFVVEKPKESLTRGLNKD